MRAHTLSTFAIPAAFGLLWRRWRSFAQRHERPDRTALRDLGIDVSEWPSVLAEQAGRATPTRRRIEPVAAGGGA